MKQTVPTPPRPDLKEKLDRWDLRGRQADLVYKVVILVAGSIVAAVFFMYRFSEEQSRSFIELQVAREKSDSDLRATMFKTLIDAYFSTAVKDATKRTQLATSDRLTDLHREVLLSDVLARNFENIDIRPVFEDLDRRLVQIIDARETSAQDRLAAFKQRLALRRVALGATSRQAASLEAVKGVSGGAKVTEIMIYQYCGIGAEAGAVEVEPATAFKDVGLTKSGHLVPTALRDDGTLVLQLYSNKDNSFTTSKGISVSFFDMPALENMPLPDGQRVAFSLTSFQTRTDCQRFPEAMDGASTRYCADLWAADDVCAMATARRVILPADFLGLRERPYQNDLLAGRYREEPWNKLWRSVTSSPEGATGDSSPIVEPGGGRKTSPPKSGLP